VEQRNRVVELILEWDEVKDIAALSGLTVAEALDSFRRQGITGIAINESTLSDLREEGLVIPVSAPPSNIRIPKGDFVYAFVASDAALKRIVGSLKAKLRVRANSSERGLVFFTRSGRKEVLPGVSFALREIGLGLPEEEVQTVQRAGLDVVARLRNDNGTAAPAIQGTLGGLKKQGIGRVIFAGDQVLGYRKLVRATAESLQANGITYGSIEFGRQKGADELERRLKGEFVRLHSITRPEMATFSPPSAVERFTRAVKERNIRLCYIRLFQWADDNILDLNLQYIGDIRDDLKKAGYQIGRVVLMQDPGVPKVLIALAGFGAIAGGVLLLTALAGIDRRWIWGFLVAGALVAVAAAFVHGSLGRKGLALLAALVFPTLALVNNPTHLAEDRARAKPFLWAVLGLYLRIAAVSLMGAALIVGLLSQREFMVKVSQFMGIKAAHVLPLLAIATIYIIEAFPYGEPWKAQRKRLLQDARRVWSQPVLVGQVLLCLIAGIILLLIVLRTGNEAGVGVSPLELKFRALLDQILVVRPRTKEFLFGHPLLILGLALSALGRRRWGTPLVVMGSIGQMSMINTFCHIHTPLAVSIIRTINGLLWGGVIGILLALIASRWALKPENMELAESPTMQAGVPSR